MPQIKTLNISTCNLKIKNINLHILYKSIYKILCETCIDRDELGNIKYKSIDVHKSQDCDFNPLKLA